jgi:MFS transporter, SP family, general alpha glucoside:H+ symporter
MESYDVFLANNFLGLSQFQKAYGQYQGVDATTGKAKWNIPPAWTSAFSCSGQLGALIGVFVAGPLTSTVGYRWATIIGLMLLNAFIFVFYYGNSLGVFFAAQILEGIPWGIFIANAPAYCSEIVPIQLRAPCTQMLQMFWAIGSIIVGAVTYSYQNATSDTAFRYAKPRGLPQTSC